MKINQLMTFHPPGRDRERLPCFPVSIIGKTIECHHQSGVVRLFPHDRVCIQELRGDHALVSHASCKGGVLLVSTSLLSPIPDEAALPTPVEDAHL